jgi:CRISPR-associated endonuclease/helicase Cas3
MSTFSGFFQAATGNVPYDYQRRLAGDTAGCPCESRLISIPTGLGKTAAVVLAWLWNRVAHPDAAHRETWPRRLVICLPMRTLVEQTAEEATKWLDAHNLRRDGKTAHVGKVGLHLLMGGADSGEWDIHPERPAILIGTQDMLLSRALNRGYGMARARWPMHFGLLNNDALWILDETQLMGVGVRTSAQLEGLRKRLGLAASTVTWWASATLDQRLLVTPDHPTPPPALALNETDLASSAISARTHSNKKLAPLADSQSTPLTLAGDSAKITAPYIDALATAVLEKHQPGTLTIVILNRVNRARDLYTALEKNLHPARKTSTAPASAAPASTATTDSTPELSLIHSRFRPMEREKLTATLKTPPPSAGKILIATQAIEAGVDISARTLITELAPWSSLVQRFGRCNRKGEYNPTNGADIFWIDLSPHPPPPPSPDDAKTTTTKTTTAATATALALPYTPEQLDTARALLRQTTDASPASLEKLHAEEPLPETSILRAKTSSNSSTPRPTSPASTLTSAGTFATARTVTSNSSGANTPNLTKRQTKAPPSPRPKSSPGAPNSSVSLWPTSRNSPTKTKATSGNGCRLTASGRNFVTLGALPPVRFISSTPPAAVIPEHSAGPAKKPKTRFPFSRQPNPPPPPLATDSTTTKASSPTHTKASNSTPKPFSMPSTKNSVPSRLPPPGPRISSPPPVGTTLAKPMPVSSAT